MSLGHHGTHPFLRDIRKPLTEPFDDLIELPSLMGSGGVDVLHDVIIAGRAPHPTQRASPAQPVSPTASQV
jgi:hypothetical protein